MAQDYFVPTQMNSIYSIKPRNHEDPSNKKRKLKSNSKLKIVWELARLLGKRTSIHGLNRLLGETEGRFERAIWFLTVVTAFVGSIYVCLLLSQRFNEGKFQTVVDSTRYPVYKIDFPVTTICNWNALNWERMEDAKRIFMPNETSSENLLLFEEFLSVYDHIEFAQFNQFHVLDGKPLENLDNVNFSHVFDFMTWRCEEFFALCEWRRKPMNCCDIFSKRRTKLGLCWSFNTVENEEGQRQARMDPMWPWRTGGFGPGSALKVRVLINPKKHNPKRFNEKGLSIIVTEPYVWHKDPVFVEADTDTYIKIEPVIYVYDNGTRRISSDQRKCVFEDEHTSTDFKSLMNYKYMIENCQAECQQEYLMRFCNCSVDLLFPPGQFPPCKAKDFLCLAQHNHNFLYLHQPDEEKYVRNEFDGMVCKCYRNCFSCQYIPETQSSPLRAHRLKNVSYVDLDVFFHADTLLVYRTSLVFGWVDLMVSFGGIAGLFLGCSLISAIELAYFAFVEMPNFVLQRAKSNQESDNNKHRKPNDKFREFKPRNVANQFNKFEEYVLKNNATNGLVDEYNRSEGLQAIRLFKKATN